MNKHVTKVIHISSVDLAFQDLLQASRIERIRFTMATRVVY